jgi:hypothetical protein
VVALGQCLRNSGESNMMRDSPPVMGAVMLSRVIMALKVRAVPGGTRM